MDILDSNTSSRQDEVFEYNMCVGCSKSLRGVGKVKNVSASIQDYRTYPFKT